jgi:hypothetical protein
VRNNTEKKQDEILKKEKFKKAYCKEKESNRDKTLLSIIVYDNE